MPAFLDLTLLVPSVAVLGLITIRLGALFIVAPVISSTSFPMRIKAALVVVIGICVLTGLPNVPLLSLNLIDLAVYAFGEALLGACAGLAARIIFAAAESAGQVLGVPMGLGFSSSVDPMTNQSSLVTSRFLAMIVGMLFFTLDVHLVLLKYVMASFTVLPPGAVHFSGAVGLHLARQAGIMFTAAIQLAAPVLVVLLGIMVSLGILARIAPKVNLFVLSFAVSVGVGVLALNAAMPNIVAYSRVLVTRIEPFVDQALRHF